MVPPKTLLLHIGHQKTGSSALQSFFALNRQELSARGIEYPLPANQSDAVKLRVTSGNRQELRKNLRELGSGSAHTVLYSSELFFLDILDVRFRDEILAAAQSQGLTVKIVCYTRDFFELMLSGWGQYIKRCKGTLGFSDFVLSDKSVPFSLNGETFDHLKTLLEFSKERNVAFEVFNYERCKSNLIDHFLTNCLSLNDGESHFKRPDRAVNRSLTLAEYELQRQFNIHFPHQSFRFISDPLVEELPEKKSEIPTFDENTYRLILDRYEAKISSLNKQLSPDEAVQITPYDALSERFSDGKVGSFVFETDQLAVLAKSVSSAMNSGNGRSLKAEIWKKAKSFLRLK